MVGDEGLLSWLMRKAHAPIYETRLRELVARILPHLTDGFRVLDVGCGSGVLACAILQHPMCPRNVEVVGLERKRRGNEGIPVYEYGAGDNQTFPFGDGSFDVVMLIDVLHHDEDAEHLIQEGARVARRYVIIKDQKVEGPLAQQRISLLDWAANDPYGVPCTYRYYTPNQWKELPQRFGFELIEEVNSMRLYPRGFDIIFGGKLNYMAVFDVMSRRKME